MNVTKRSGLAGSSPVLAALLYGCLLLGLAAATALPLKALLDQRTAVASLGDTLLGLERHGGAAGRPLSGADDVAGSSFLEGATVTVAGAALLQRVVGTVTRHGGDVLSSQLDLQGPQSKEGFLSVGVNCDVEQAALQQIVYDLEVGKPFLFVDQLAVQAPTASAGRPGEKLRVMISVSGQWQGAQ